MRLRREYLTLACDLQPDDILTVAHDTGHVELCSEDSRGRVITIYLTPEQARLVQKGIKAARKAAQEEPLD